VIVLKLELSASRKYSETSSGITEKYCFAVLDRDKAGDYPLNFVCMLPKNLKRARNSTSKFLEIYGNESSQIAIELLSKALRCEGDLKLRAELEKRLKALQAKPITKCAICGCVFEPRKYHHFMQRICLTCRYKSNSSQ
jgi:hypothetical protein